MKPTIAFRQLKQLHTPGHGCDRGSFSTTGVDAILKYSYSDEEGSRENNIRFTRVVAYRFTNEAHTKDFPSDAYDCIVEVVGSDWLKNLKEPTLWPFVRRHIVIYLSNVGCFELIAEDFEECSDN